MSQMASLLKAEKAALKGMILAATPAVTARKAQAPVGKGSNTSPVTQTQTHAFAAVNPAGRRACSQCNT